MRSAGFLPLLLPLLVTALGLSSTSVAQTQALSLTRSIRTTVFNAYPNVTVNAFVVFEVESVNRIKYGQERMLNITYQQHADFLLEFKKEITDGTNLSVIQRTSLTVANADAIGSTATLESCMSLGTITYLNYTKAIPRMCIHLVYHCT